MTRQATRTMFWIAACTLLTVNLCAAATDLRPSYEMDLAIDWESGTYDGTLIVLAPNPSSHTYDALTFRLFPNAVATYRGASLEVDGAAQAGVSLTVSLDDSDPTVLTVALLEPLQPSQTTSVTLRFHGTAGPSTATSPSGTAGYGILTKNDNSLVLTAFYPLLAPLGEDGAIVSPDCGFGDTLWSEASDYSVRVTAGRDLDVASTGHLVCTTSDEGAALHLLEADGARDFALVLTRGLSEVRLQSGGRVLDAWFTPEHTDAAVRAISIAEATQRLYAKRIGPLPYAEIDLVEVPLDRAAGVEFSGLILLSSSYCAHPGSTFFDILVSHETVHQWFYSVVGSDPAAAPWVDEGLATYLSYVYLEEYAAPPAAASYRTDWIREYSAARLDYPMLSIATASCAFPTAEAYRVFVYAGAALFWDEVRSALGDAAFFSLLQTYYESYAGSIASSDNLVDLLLQLENPDILTAMAEYGVGRQP